MNAECGIRNSEWESWFRVLRQVPGILPPGYNRIMGQLRASQLRFLGMRLYRLLLLGSPIWICLLVVNFSAQASIVALPILYGLITFFGATAIPLLLDRMNRGHDKPLLDRPPGVVRFMPVEAIRSKLQSIRKSQSLPVNPPAAGPDSPSESN